MEGIEFTHSGPLHVVVVESVLFFRVIIALTKQSCTCLGSLRGLVARHRIRLALPLATIDEAVITNACRVVCIS
jgi:hypothetical protein